MQNKILIVDDEPSNIEILINFLEEHNYQIIVATNGKAGYELAKKTLPDLILMDWDMPEFDGIQTIELISNCNITQNIPIIMTTGKMLSSENLQTALEAGATDYIRKPIDKIEFLARVRSMLILFRAMKENLELANNLALEKELKLTTEIENNKKELTKNALRLVNYNELSNWVHDKLNTITSENEEDIQTINEIKSKIKISENSNLWQEFEVVFELVNSDFFESLTNKFPNISLNEKKLCALLKLNMSSKDISMITFQSIQAIKKARYRLRKKFELERDDDLVKFIENL